MVKAATLLLINASTHETVPAFIIHTSTGDIASANGVVTAMQTLVEA